MRSGKHDRLIGLFAIGAAIWLGYRALGFPADGHVFPLFVSGCMILVGGLMLLPSRARYAGPEPAGHGSGKSWDAWKPIVILAATIVYVIAIFNLGYYVSTIVFLLVTPWILGLNRLALVTGFLASGVGFIYVLFGLVLGVELPSGMLF